jgi:hypothetical protein
MSTETPIDPIIADVQRQPGTAAPDITEAAPEDRIGQLLRGRGIQIVPDAVIEKRNAEERAGRVAALRGQAGCPERASRFLREHAETWPGKHAGVGNTRGHLLRLLRQVGGATILLYGYQGTGKTVLAVDVIRQATEAMRKARFVTAMMLLAELLDAKVAGELAKDLRQWTSVDVLVVDQFDKLAGADWEQRLIFDVLDARHNAERVTVLVANGSTDEVAEKLGTSIIQRCQEAGGFFECNWEKFRGAIAA